MLALSLALRLTLFPFRSGDMVGDMIPWSNFIEEHGFFSALQHSFCNYPPLFQYILIIATLLPVDRIFAIKFTYSLFDYIASWYVLRIVTVATGDCRIGRWAMLFTLFLPTMVFNSSLWGQCDAMYASFMVAAVYYLMAEKQFAAMTMISLAFSLKPQAIFLAPLFLAFLIAKRIAWWLIYVPLLVYFALSVPAWIAGRPILDLLFLYVGQPILPRPSLTLGATNLYQWLSDDYFDIFYRAGLVGATTAALALGFAIFRRVREGCSREEILGYALVSAVLLPYCLPAMHERYFFAADILAIAFVAISPRHWGLALMIQASSFFTYLPYLFNKEPVPRPFLALLLGAALVWLLRILFWGEMAVRCRSIETSPTKNPEAPEHG